MDTASKSLKQARDNMLLSHFMSKELTKLDFTSVIGLWYVLFHVFRAILSSELKTLKTIHILWKDQQWMKWKKDTTFFILLVKVQLM